MTLATIVPAVVLDTIIGRLAILFLFTANGDVAAAHDAAAQMLAAYNPETEDELCLAAKIISFGFHALEALSQAAVPDLPLTKILRLRGCAVSLSWESHKAQRKLDQLQRDRRAGIQPQPRAAKSADTVPTPSSAQIDKALALIEETRQEMMVAGNTGARTGGMTWTQAYQHRQTAKRIAENLKKNQAVYAASSAAATADIGLNCCQESNPG
jgi:hypothetical protein